MIYRTMTLTTWMRLLLLVAILNVPCSMCHVCAQITIGGNVYGGGNAGDTGGSTKVTIYAGDLHAVFAGARMANVGGSAFVHIDGEHASNYILADYVYGGNDIAGTIGTSTTLPAELVSNVNGVDNTWNAFVHLSTKTTTTGEGANAVITEDSDAKPVYIGQLFGGGNGEYTYSDKKGNGKYDVTVDGKTVEDVDKPELGKTYLDIHGGSIVYAYGGGNAATVTDKTIICLNNPSKVIGSIIDTTNPNAGAGGELLNEARFEKMRINTTFSYPNSDAFQIGRLFGGNNKADMAIRPRWNLKRGKVRMLYGGGNEGRMTSPEGLLLQLDGEEMIVDNVYGGCRKADVRPLYNNNDETPVPYDEIQLDPNDNPNNIPGGYAARLRVLAGHVNNVYGGNDISGNIYGGSTVGILTRIYGNVYGGGNGSYAYTDNAKLKDNPKYSDFYYNPDEVLQKAGVTATSNDLKSAEALNIFRPNAERVSILVRGTEAKPTVVEGAFYVGGNSASLRSQTNSTSNSDSHMTHVKIGSHVIIDNVFLGNNGENMIKYDDADAEGRGEGVLKTYSKYVKADGTIVDTQEDVAATKFNSMDLTDKDVFAKYMEGCAMKVNPTIVFENTQNGDAQTYVAYSTKFGSLFCGGNVGSIIVPGKITVDFNDKIIIYDKVVGGCNNANVYETAYNAEYLGGMLGDAADAPEGAIGDKLELNFGGLKIQPMRWKKNGNDYAVDSNGNRILEWNTISASTGKEVAPITEGTNIQSNDADLDRRFKGGNIYGGCYNTGHVNGNVIINLNASLEDRKGDDAIFDQVEQNEGEAILYAQDSYKILQRRSGVLLDKQGMDVLGKALNVFGGGYGPESEIWGSTTINLNAGYTFQIFGGGEKGAIGHGTYNATAEKLEYNEYDSRYSCYVNLKGNYEGVYRGHAYDNNDMAEAEFIYGGSFEAPIAGNTVINLGNGRIFNSFAGSCNADILGHTETYIGRSGVDANGNDILGFPWIRDHVYGGNDLGGRIMNTRNFKDRVSADIRDKVYNPKAAETPIVTSASAYMEYLQGRVDNIYGGCYGVYDYKDRYFSDYTNANGLAKGDFTKPRMISAFINFKPLNHTRNAVNRIYGAGQGYSGDSDRDVMQDRSYVLIDIPKDNQKYQDMEVFGAGDFCGLGMRNEDATYRTVNNAQVEVMPALNPDIAKANADGITASAVIDLFRGQIGAAYGASCNEGITRRTIVNVPEESTIRIGSIFGGAYGADAYKPCDVYEAHVNYLTKSEDAYLISNPASSLKKGAIYGGNNFARRTLYGQINISAPVRQQHHQYGMTTATVYGAGCGSLTWNEYTEVNLNNGAKVWEVYGGGEAGSVMSAESVQAYLKNYKPTSWPKEKETDPDVEFTDADWLNAWSLGKGYDPEIENKTPLESLKEGYANNTPTNLDNSLVRVAEMDDRSTKTYRYNTNVIIHKGAYVGNYAYGGGLGNADDAFVGSGDVYGTTYIALLGGIVNKDLYAAGTSGAVYNIFGAENLTASSNAFIAGGSTRNVYGGGWKGSVGYHKGNISETAAEDVLGETHVVIGIRPDQASVPADYGFYNGVPAIQRNAYGGGEGGSIIGKAHLTLNNGYIGYLYSATEPTDKTIPYIEVNGGYYQEKVNDETWTDHVGEDRLSDCGNLFGGGYDDNSSVDESHVTMWGGTVRNTIFGGGEIATIGRGATKESGEDNKDRTIEAIYKAGKTYIEMYNGHVKRNIFGGGKGYNILGYGGTRGFYTDGYVFGSTEVYIHGGEIGTDEGLAEGYGNVFGGGDVGFVYSKGYFNEQSRKTGTGSPNHYYYYDENGKLTEDCKVVVAPMLQVKKNGSSVTFNGETYGPYDYVPTDYLNTLPAEKTNAGWLNLYTGDKLSDDDQIERGIHIHNAVFAGGNVSSNSENYSNATTVFGNTTATLYDVYHHDFITVGTEHTGGLYGGGNLSLVGGYRELNITNYGTDYYGLDQQISLEEYGKLTNRERAYFKLEYLCQQDVNINGKAYKKDERISEDEYNALPAAYKSETYWIQYGFCSIYAGRLLNTIQRADFCGVFGSRLVMQGAKDRVADVADATEYTINRIGEVSLNQQRSVAGDTEESKMLHGNYFGIYSGVNYLGNLTSDVHFDDPRRYVEKGLTYESGTADTYYKWKEEHLTKRDRNNGTSYNQVALASGVFLELTSENSTPKNKIYGDITGIVELDLINVKKDIEGGGYVYARNEHGARSYDPTKPNVLLSEYNMQKIVNGVEWRDEARTHKRYTYRESDLKEMQTSGNFIHKSKRIVDDCYPNNGIYKDGYKKSPAHYWFIKGEVYIYDQVVSAYAGSASAYSKEVKIPLTITAGSNGRLKLLNVQPSLYAYYADESRSENKKVTKDGVKVDNESTTYYLNDVITWWDWNQLSQNEQKYFVKETYVNVDPCTIDGEVYAEGTYVLENDPSIHAPGEATAYEKFLTGGHKVLDSKDEPVTDLTNLFHSSNNVGHDTGYVLTLDMNSPKDWDDWYSPVLRSDGGKIRKDAYEKLTNQAKYREGPTYTLTGASGLYGQREYGVGEIITKEVFDDYTNTVSRMVQQPEGQATAEPAYVALADYGNTQAGNAISETEYNALTNTNKSNFDPAMVCINSIQLGEEDYVLLGELVSGTDASLKALAQRYKTYNNSLTNTDDVDDAEALEYVKSHLSAAYYIKDEGLYGGQYYESGENYGAIKSWCTLSDDRHNFNYNYDALDVLVDPSYPGEGYTSVYGSPYDEIKSVEYEAVYNGTGTLTYYDNDNTSHTISSGKSIDREAYEKVRNDQLHYTRVQVDQGSDEQTVYIVNETLIDNGTPYAKGQDISEKDYKALSTVNQAKVDKVTFQKGSSAAVKYYCYENYTPSGSFVTEKGTAGQKGSVISASVFNDNIPNYQKNFAIQGSEPTETTTLYVSRESNARDVTSEKVISVVYQYTYYEADDEGEGVSLVNELHVLNIHLQLESGAPEIGPLTTPPTVLPGNSVGLKAPIVNPGLYEILTSGWELFNSEDDAMLHRNGVPFVNNGTPLYWYQNEKVFLAFYSKTYLGKTYSNYVPLSVANYHDLDAIMKDKENHLYVDHPDVMRNSKIYIDNRDCKSDATKSELDLLKDFFDLSNQTAVASSGATKDHALLNPHVKGGADLEFILNSDVSPKKYTDWTPIGNEMQCFMGNLHGDGHTVSGLNHSLFGSLCGNVYNLGVTGSFTSAGVADSGSGYVENCWINTTGTPAADVKAVFNGGDDGSQKEGNHVLLTNCYYPKSKAYKSGLATPMTELEFYNGTVAYNLNSYFLNKRYYDNNTSWTGNKVKYNYFKSTADGDIPEAMSEGQYPDTYAFYPLEESAAKLRGYVEERYHDGDFVYAGGTVPEAYDERMRVTIEDEQTVVVYAPIWPDDYIYFGQTLSYGFNATHQDEPSSVSKSGGRITANGNRVYRAPAYYGSSEMGVAHFNSNAVISAYSKPKTITDTDLKEAYPGMTAIDFAGHNDNNYKQGLNDKLFYQPLLDDDGLQSISTNGETQNLLVYAPTKADNPKTFTVLSNYFTEPAFGKHYDETDIYRRVIQANSATVHGHLVQGNLKATSDHLLVDKQDFNCPVAFEFDGSHRMWYQRMPDNYVDDQKGWESVSLPFSAELVTTPAKGEITHFYQESTTGHEYWLREFKGGNISTSNDKVFVGNFEKPAAGLAGSKSKEFTNTFLWDYYYSKDDSWDENKDTYHKTYYSEPHTYNAYAYSAAGTPYLIGFPGSRYYEFDLSGEWTPENRYQNVSIASPGRQLITFASAEDARVNVSDEELKPVAANGYRFVPNYSNTKLSTAGEGYVLADDGGSFNKNTAGVVVAAFRPYFTAGTNGTRAVEQIIFGEDDSSFDDKEHGDPREGATGTLKVWTKKGEIFVESSLSYTTDVRIVTPAGITVAAFAVKAGETVTVQADFSGMYVVYTLDGRYIKKLSVKK